ncbi:MAG: hypothetical protein CO093_05555, partial [Alphaproteobacteria bacterium CG_4_9_14_3_um_filter_47_13]
MGSNGTPKAVRYLGTLQKPLIVPSELSLDEVEGILTRNMVTPEMQRQFFEVINAIHPKNTRRAMYTKGTAGSGKTFQGELAGRISSKEGALKIDCTNMNLNELFFEMVLDFNSDKRFYDALDSKIEKYNRADGDKQQQDFILNPMSVDILSDCLGNAFSSENGKIAIDWAAVKHAHPGETRDSINIAIEGLTKVSAKEGLDNLGGNTLGMAAQEGPAWQAYKEGRMLILDELNRAKRGTYGVLHDWMLFVNGDTQECLIRNPLKEKGDKSKAALHFKHSEMGCGHFVYMTGNDEGDSDEVMELPEALSSRVVPDTVAQSTELGWQHRWCQALTGLPVSTLYYMQRPVWDKDPEAFGEDLIRRRKQAETKEIPEYHMERLGRWRDVLQATAMLSKFMYGAAKMVNPESDWHKSGTLAHLLDNIDEVFKKESAMDYRKINYFTVKAEQPKPIVRPPQNEGDIEIVPLLSEKDMPETREGIQSKFGTHISYVILDWIMINTYERGKDALGNQLMRLAADCGLIEPSLTEGMKSDR